MAGGHDPLTIVSPAGPCARYAQRCLDGFDDQAFYAQAGADAPPRPTLTVTAFTPAETPTAVFVQDGWSVRAALVDHHPIEAAVGYRIDVHHRSVAISGDTAVCDGVAELAADADLLVHEAVRSDRASPQLLAWNTSAHSVGELARSVGLPRLVLSHLLPAPQSADDEAAFLSEARAGGYEGDIVSGAGPHGVGARLAGLTQRSRSARRNGVPSMGWSCASWARSRSTTAASEIAVGGARPRALLARLLLARGHAVSLDTLVSALWDGEPPRTARQQIHKVVSEVRRRLPGLVETVEGLGYRARLDDHWLDADEADELLSRGDPASIERALALWRGDTLEGIDGIDLRAAAEAWDERRLGALAAVVRRPARPGWSAGRRDAGRCRTPRRAGEPAVAGGPPRRT